MRKICSLLPLLLVLSCGEITLVSGGLGSDYKEQTIDGKQQLVMTNKSLAYIFNGYKGGALYKDLFNYIYFEGDTVCFTFTYTKSLKGFYPEIVFVNPANGKSYAPERIDIKENTAAGFSLTGTLLEQFLHDRLFQKLPAAIETIELPFEVHMKLNTGNTIILENLKGTCIIQVNRS